MRKLGKHRHMLFCFVKIDICQKDWEGNRKAGYGGCGGPHTREVRDAVANILQIQVPRELNSPKVDQGFCNKLGRVI